MIVEWFLGLVAIVVDWFWSLWPNWTAPQFLTDFGNILNPIFDNLSGVGVWADWGYILGVVLVVLAVWGVSFGLKIARAIAAHLPFFGGAG